MGIGEAGAAARQAINRRCLHAGGSIARQVAIAEVIGQDDNYVGTAVARTTGLAVMGKGWQGRGGGGQSGQGEGFFHG